MSIFSPLAGPTQITLKLQNHVVQSKTDVTPLRIPNMPKTTNRSAVTSESQLIFRVRTRLFYAKFAFEMYPFSLCTDFAQWVSVDGQNAQTCTGPHFQHCQCFWKLWRSLMVSKPFGIGGNVGFVKILRALSCKDFCEGYFVNDV